MKRSLILFLIFLVPGLISGCGYFQKKDEPPPLPPIEEKKPPLTMKSEYFKAFPWKDISPKASKDGNEPDTTVYNVKEGDTLDKIAETQMGNPRMDQDLATYNDLSARDRLAAGDKLVIPNPIIGISSQLLVKPKKETDFTPAKAFGVEMKPGDQYKMRFESNVDGYAYILREGLKGVEFLYPATPKTAPKRGKKAKPVEPPADTGKIEAFQPIDIPASAKGFTYDPKKKGDNVIVFLSLRKIPDLEELRERSLKDKKKIKQVDVEDVMLKVKQGEIFSQPPYNLLRITDPKDILGFTLQING